MSIGITEKEKEQIIDLRIEGFSYDAIKKKLNISDKEIAEILFKHGKEIQDRVKSNPQYKTTKEEQKDFENKSIDTTDEGLTDSVILEIIKLKLKQVTIDEISIKLGISIPQISQALLINKELVKAMIIRNKLNNDDLFDMEGLPCPIKSISLQHRFKNGNVYGVERNIKFLFPEIDVKDFLQKYYVIEKLSPDEICKVIGFGSQKGWINIVQRYGLARSRKEAQKAKWTTDRGKRHLEKLKPHLELVTGHGTRKSLSPKLRWEIMEKYEFTCQKCGRIPPEVVIEVEHIKPVRDEGITDSSNLTVLCDECNIGKYHSEKHKKLEKAKKIETAREIYKKKLSETYNYKVEGKIK